MKKDNKKEPIMDTFDVMHQPCHAGRVFWVNAYETHFGAFYDSRESCIAFNRTSKPLYRIKVKCK